MKRKTKRFDGEEGSQVFSEAQEKWLGGADRTDPYILARMRKAVPDEPKAEPKAEPKEEIKPTVIESSEETGNKGTATKSESKSESKPAPKAKAASFESNFPKQEDKSKEAGPSGKAKAQQERSKGAMERAVENAGPDKVDSAKRAGEEKRAKEREHFESTGLYKLGKALFSKKSPNRSYKAGGAVKRSSASSRGDGIATKGHTRGKVY